MLLRRLCFACVFFFSSTAFADWGDIALGGQMGVGFVDIQTGDAYGPSSRKALLLQPEIHLRVGLTDWLNLDTGVGFVSFDDLNGGSVDLGLTGTFDVFAVVPEVKLGLCLAALREDQAFRALVGLDAAIALRYHLDFNWSVALGAELNVAIVPRYQGTLSFLYVIE